MKCVLVGCGDFCKEKFAVAEGDYVVAVDGGYDKIKDLCRVDLAVGDFDSLGYLPEGIATLRHDPVKDYTDMQLALEETFRQGHREFVIYGALGGRLDHTLGNLQIAYAFARKGADVKLVDNSCDVEIIKDTKRFQGHAGQVFSLFAFDLAKGVDIVNAKYPLDNATLTNTFPIGVSNELLDGECEVRVKEGTLLFILQR